MSKVNKFRFVNSLRKILKIYEKERTLESVTKEIEKSELASDSSRVMFNFFKRIHDGIITIANEDLYLITSDTARSMIVEADKQSKLKEFQMAKEKANDNKTTLKVFAKDGMYHVTGENAKLIKDHLKSEYDAKWDKDQTAWMIDPKMVDGADKDLQGSKVKLYYKLTGKVADKAVSDVKWKAFKEKQDDQSFREYGLSTAVYKQEFNPAWLDHQITELEKADDPKNKGLLNSMYAQLEANDELLSIGYLVEKTRNVNTKEGKKEITYSVFPSENVRKALIENIDKDTDALKKVLESVLKADSKQSAETKKSEKEEPKKDENVGYTPKSRARKNH